MNKYFATTERLLIDALSPADKFFILELLNTEGWLTYIGDRNVQSVPDAEAYINRILENKSVEYWVVKLHDGVPIGIVTWIKRQYLEYHDIGFAFLPGYNGKGYAHEAVTVVLAGLLKSYEHPYILATTIPSNTRSINLLTKLGLRFQRELEVDGQTLYVYGLSILKETPGYLNSNSPL